MAYRKLTFFILTLKLCTASNSAAEAHCFSRWNFPWRQNCALHGPTVQLRNFRVKSVQASFEPEPSPKTIENKPVFGPPADIPDIPGPTASDIEWWDAIAKLKASMETKP